MGEGCGLAAQLAGCDLTHLPWDATHVTLSLPGEHRHELASERDNARNEQAECSALWAMGGPAECKGMLQRPQHTHVH